MALSDALDDIKDGADDLKGASKDFNKSHGKFKKSSKSIIKAAKGNIFEFPVFASSSVPLDYATASVSLVEQVYASYLQMAISINPIIDDEMARKGAQFDHLRSDTNKYLECVDPTDMPYAYDACHNVFVEDGMRVEFNLVNIEDSMARIINEAVDHQPLSEFDHFFNEAYTGDGAGFFDGCEFIQEATAHVKKSGNTRIDNLRYKHYDTIDDFRNAVKDPKAYVQLKGINDRELSTAVKNVIDYQTARLKQAEADAALRAITDPNSREYKLAEAKLKEAENNANMAEEKAKSFLDKQRTEKTIDSKTIAQLESVIKKNNKDLEEATETWASRKKKIEKDADNSELEYLERLATSAARINKTKDDARKAKADADRAEKDSEHYDEDRELRNKKTSAEISKAEHEVEKMEREDRWAKEDRELDRMKKMNDARVKTPQFLDETKIQKLNTMKPLMMSVDLNVVDKNGSLSRPVSYVIGVKCHTRLIDADILPEVAAYPLKEMNKKLRKVKWRAGELKFGRDILWKKTSKKQTASDSRDPKRKWYRRLYELAHMSGDGTAAASIKNGKSPWANWWQDKLTGGNNKDVGHGLIPNATIIMSKSDIDNIKREKDIDLLSGSKASKFCKELFLIGLIVIDDDKEAVKVMFPDLHDDYEVHSLAAIKKQLATLDTAGTKTRDIMKILG